MIKILQNKKKNLNIVFVITIFIYLLMIVFYHLKSGFKKIDGDNYTEQFISFLENGFYYEVSNGTSILYNLVLYVFYKITNSIDLSFIILNSITHILILIISIKILKKVFKNSINIYFYYLIVLYSLYILNQSYFISRSNDYFMAIFILLIIYKLINFSFDKSKKEFVVLGALIGLSLSIRMTAIYLIILLIATIFIKYTPRKIDFLKTFLIFITIIFTLFIFHFPSLISNKKLSYENKNPIDCNWVQRNYLGLKKIEEKNLKPHRDVIWKETNFDEVRNHLKNNGKNSLPNSFFEFLIKDPILLIKITVFNFYTFILRYIRFWGFLFFFIFIPFYDIFLKFKIKNSFNKIYFESFLFILLSIVVSFTCLTFVEFRWFAGYEILIPIAIYKISLDFKNKVLLYYLFLFSFILISLFNIKSLISYL
jgi:hypothetical protein